MKNINNAVWKLIDADPSIQLDLDREIVNVRALARYCVKQGIGASENALISAIRRYPKSKTRPWYDQARRVLAQSHVSAKSQIVYIELNKGDALTAVLPELLPMVRYEKGETFRILQGEESIRLLVDEKNADRMLEKIPAKSVLNMHRNLGELNVHLPSMAGKTPGVVYVVSGELARNNINMYEMLGGAPELLIFIAERDLMSAYKVLFELCNAKGK
ncbi:MAG TPA: hypothetical protein VI874_04420 [Candidatus Norongarragalinales archaeon]|nr:hypothetical protein [Candidatus Norongarragalinales archaeon]